MRSAFLSPALLVLVLAGCKSKPFDPVLEQQRLLQRDAEWEAVAAEGKDVGKTLSYWSDDALVMPQGQPVLEGKAAIRAFVETSFRTPGFSIHWKSEKVSFSPDGKLAYMRSTSTTTVPGTGGGVITLQGRGVTVWRLDLDGQWR